MRITFLPPPLDGTLSLGLFNKAGKLVRTLHREARTKEFVVGLNGLVTWWDGKDDAGARAPAGNYFARGFAVGAVEFEGEAFHFNDWIADEKSPRIRRIDSISPRAGFPSTPWAQMTVTLADGKKGGFAISEKGETSAFSPSKPDVAPQNMEQKKGDWGTTEGDVRIILTYDGQGYGLKAGQLVIRQPDGDWKSAGLAPVENAVEWVFVSETDGLGWWIIDRVTGGTEVKRFASDGTFVRSLFVPADQPQPFGLCVGADDSFLILLEAAPGLQRVRTLERRRTEPPEDADPDAPKASEWAVTLSKTIRASDTLADVQAELKTEAGEPFAAVEKIAVRLLPNQLVQNKITSVEVGVGVDAKGSFLRTADGLPLKRITETPGLKWAAMMRETGGKGVTIFQSDGAVVEEFKARKLASMMAFDAGDYDWAGK